jgi:single-strand DNA-binding protein
MVNVCTFIGRLGSDPRVATTEQGVKVAMFNIACDEKGYTTKDGRVVEKRTEWVPVVLWRGLAEVAEKYLKKGDLVYIQGKFRTRQYENKEGQRLYATEVYAEEMNMLAGNRNGAGNAGAPLPPDTASGAAPQPAPAQPTDQQPTDDLPF